MQIQFIGEGLHNKEVALALSILKGKNITLTNQHVIPYSPLLSELFNCHINVEFCATIKAIQYLFKLQLKGPDQATISLENANNPDEIGVYESRTYIGSMEAMWRILQLPTVEVKPAVTRLPVQLEGWQRIVYQPNNPEEAQEAFAKGERTMITAYFEGNQDIPEAKDIKYSNFPEYFTWNYTYHKWYLRKKALNSDKPPDSIGRLRTVHPGQVEEFCLRQLLLHRAGATSFAALRTIRPLTPGAQPTVHSTFKAACIALHLIEDDASWIKTLDKACLTNSPISCRRLFVFVLLECTPADPGDLYERFKEHMKLDFKRL